MPSVAPFDIDDHVIAAAFLGGVPFFATASGTIHKLDEGEKVTEAHDGLLTCIRDPFSRSLITGGEDGRVLRISADGSVTELASEPRKWISVVAGGPQGAVAYAVGRESRVIADGKTMSFPEERSVEGIAFAPKGLRIAVARYDGVSLRWVGGAAPAIWLPWKGAHLGAAFSPDGRFLVTTMQENALHGWKLDGKPKDGFRDMRMSGYPAKVKSWSWSPRGKWLATSGAPAAIVWPFSGKDGPMGKAPLELGTRSDILVTQVAFHPHEEMLAIGFVDGMALAVRISDGKEALLRRPGKGAISALSWDEDGKRLAFASEAGDCGIITIAD